MEEISSVSDAPSDVLARAWVVGWRVEGFDDS
jgi:hypothetical protein